MTPGDDLGGALQLIVFASLTILLCNDRGAVIHNIKNDSRLALIEMIWYHSYYRLYVFNQK